MEGEQVVAEFTGPRPPVLATLQFTSGAHRENKTRPWLARLLTIDGNKVRGEAPPADATAWYVTVTDDAGVQVSSEVVLP